MKKFLPYILILVILAGIFNPVIQAHAQSAAPATTPAAGTACTPTGGGNGTINTQGQCVSGIGSAASTSRPDNQFQQQYDATTQCWNGVDSDQGTLLNVPGCLVEGFYWLLYALPAFILSIAAVFFDALVAISLNSMILAGSGFMQTAWAIVRDLSNIFFILILLYIAIKLILGLGGHDTKKMIAKVIIIALLINFSMFFTEVIIDTSNIIALIFYNKISVVVKNPDGSTSAVAYTPVTTSGDKDIAGGMTAAFNPTSALTWNNFFEQAKNIQTQSLNDADAAKEALNPTYEPVPVSARVNTISPSLMIGIIVITGALMLFASYAFLWAGIAFVSRIIELWVLIIFSPFAFMSSTVPILGHVEYLGWDAWFKRLLKVSFMAPIFMFFMYFIFLLIQANPFRGAITSQGFLGLILAMVLPGMFILILLMKATEFAKKGSGVIGEKLMQGAKMVGGLALGAATGGASLLGTGLLGGLASKAAGNETLKEKANEKGFGGYAARKALQTANYGSKATFDIRKTALGGTLAKKAGLDLQSAKVLGLGSKEGGYKGDVERKTKALEEESKLYKTTKTDAQVKAWSDARQKEYNAQDEEYKKTHERPKEYATADSLNQDRLRAFQSNLGQSGLLGTAAFEVVKRGLNGIIDKKNFSEDGEYIRQYTEKYKDDKDKLAQISTNYDADIAKQVNDKRVKTAKMVIGGTLATVGGGIVGAYAAGAIGASAGHVLAAKLGGAALGGSYAGGYAMAEGSAEHKFSEQTDKELKKLGDIDARLSEMKDVLKNQTKVLAEGAAAGFASIKKDKNGNSILDINQDPVYEVDTKKLTDALANASIHEQDLKSQLEALNRRLAEPGNNRALTNDLNAEKERIKAEMFTSTTKTAELNALKGMEQTIANTRNQIYNLTGTKAGIKDAAAGHTPVPPGAAPQAPAAGHAPTTPAPTPPPTSGPAPAAPSH